MKLKKILERSVCAKFVIHLWAAADSQSNLNELVKQSRWTYLPENCDIKRSFKFSVYCFGKKVTQESKTEKIESMDFLPFDGPIIMKNPDNIFYLVEYYGLGLSNKPTEPLKIFFGKWLSNGNRKAYEDFSLKTRKFISNTSMDPLFSIMMANLALVKPNDIIVDPFVGSGSILIGAANMGAYVLGTDIDFLLLHGQTRSSRAAVKERDPNESILTNFNQYKLESKYLDVIVADASKELWSNFEFDAIITDPPYGIRENSQKVGTYRNYTIPEELADQHIPSKVHYSLENIVDDLFNFSLKNLKLGGRLVFWLPKYRSNNLDESIPKHSSFNLISFAVQQLAQNVDRILVCYEMIDKKGVIVELPDSIKTFRSTFLTNTGKTLSLKDKIDSSVQ